MKGLTTTYAWNHSSLSFRNISFSLSVLSVIYSTLLYICCTDIVQCCWGICCTLILCMCVFMPKCIYVTSYWIKVMTGIAWGQCLKAVWLVSQYVIVLVYSLLCPLSPHMISRSAGLWFVEVFLSPLCLQRPPLSLLSSFPLLSKANVSSESFI